MVFCKTEAIPTGFKIRIYRFIMKNNPFADDRELMFMNKNYMCYNFHFMFTNCNYLIIT